MWQALCKHSTLSKFGHFVNQGAVMHQQHLDQRNSPEELPRAVNIEPPTAPTAKQTDMDAKRELDSLFVALAQSHKERVKESCRCRQ